MDKHISWILHVWSTKFDITPTLVDVCHVVWRRLKAIEHNRPELQYIRCFTCPLAEIESDRRLYYVNFEGWRWRRTLNFKPANDHVWFMQLCITPLHYHTHSLQLIIGHLKPFQLWWSVVHSGNPIHLRLTIGPTTDTTPSIKRYTFIINTWTNWTPEFEGHSPLTSMTTTNNISHQ